MHDCYRSLSLKDSTRRSLNVIYTNMKQYWDVTSVPLECWSYLDKMSIRNRPIFTEDSYVLLFRKQSYENGHADWLIKNRVSIN